MKALKGRWKEIPILDGTTNTILKTNVPISINETLILSNDSDGVKKEKCDGITIEYETKTQYTIIESNGVSLDTIGTYGIVKDNSGDLYICGRVDNSAYVIKLDKYFNVMLQRIFNDTVFNDICILPSGDFVVCGSVQNGSVQNFYIVKFNADLEIISQYTVDNDNNCAFNGISCVDNDLIVCGTYYDGTKYSGYMVSFDTDLTLKDQILTTADNDIYYYDISYNYDDDVVVVCGSMQLEASAVPIIVSYTYDKSNSSFSFNTSSKVETSGTNDEFRKISYFGSEYFFLCGTVDDKGYIARLQYSTASNSFSLQEQYTVDDVSELSCVYTDSNSNSVFVCNISSGAIFKFDDSLNLIDSYYCYTENETVRNMLQTLYVDTDNDEVIFGGVLRQSSALQHNLLLLSTDRSLTFPQMLDIVGFSSYTAQLTSQTYSLSDMTQTTDAATLTQTSQTFSASYTIWDQDIRLDSVYNVNISSFEFLSIPTKALKFFGSIWVSEIQEQESGDNDWYQYQISVTEKPPQVDVQSTSTSTILATTTELKNDDFLVIYNNSDGFREGSAGQITDRTKPIVATGSSYSLRGIAVDSDYIYVSGSSDIYCAKFDKKLNLVKIVRDTEYTSTSGIVVDDNCIYITCEKEVSSQYYVGVVCLNKDDLSFVASGGYVELNVDNHKCSYNATDVFLVYKTWASGKKPYGVLIKMDKSSLDVQSKTDIYIGSTNDPTHSFIPSNVVATSDSIYVSGKSSGESHWYGSVIKFDLNLNKQADRKVLPNDISSCGFYGGFVIDSSGFLYCCGEASDNPMLVKFDNSLNVVSLLTVNVESVGYGFFKGVCCDNEGNVYGVAEINLNENSTRTCVVFKFDSSLNQIRQIEISNSSNDVRVDDIAFDNITNSVVICGESSSRPIVIILTHDLDIPKTNFSCDIYDWTITESTYSVTYPSYTASNLSINTSTHSESGFQPSASLTELPWTYNRCIGGFYEVDISSFGFTSPPEKAWRNPIEVYALLEQNRDRCLFQDDDISDKIQNATNSYFEFKDERSDLVVTGDKLIINGNRVAVENVVVSNVESTNLYKITVSEQDSVITSVVIPSRLTVQTISHRQLDSNDDFFISKYSSVEKIGRELRVGIKGIDMTEVSKIQVDLWEGV